MTTYSESMADGGWVEDDLFPPDDCGCGMGAACQDDGFMRPDPYEQAGEPSTYSGAPDECSIHWPKKPHECGCEPPVDHVQVLNKMLANTCPRNILADGWNVYQFDLCCAEIDVEARCVSRVVMAPGKPVFNYEIRKVVFT